MKKNLSVLSFLKSELLCFLLLFTSLSASAQWEFKGYGPSFRHLNAAQILAGGNIVAGGGWPANDAISSLYVSSDTANSWDIRMDAVNAMLNDLHFPNSQIGYAVGNEGRIFKSSDGGFNWVTQPLTGNIATRNYTAVHFVDPLTGVAVGGNLSNDSIQTILRTTDGGANWNIISDNLGSMLADLYFLDATHGFAVGNQGKILYTQDAGASWSLIPLSGNLLNRQLHAVHFSTPQNGIIVGGYPDDDSIQTILRTTDGGQNWTIVKDVVASMLRTVYFLSATEGYAAGDDGVMLHTTDAGATWTAVNIQGNDAYTIMNLHFVSAGYGIAVGLYGKTLIYKDSSNSPPAVFMANPSIINVNSVNILGTVNTYSHTATVEFEYGTTNAFGTTLAMTPPSVSGTAVPVSLVLNGLFPNTVYYGRIKATSIMGTGHSSTIPFYTDVTGVPNFDFEDWNTFSYDILHDWQTVGQVHRVASHNGSFAARFSPTATQTPGVLIYANVSDDGNGGAIIKGLPINIGRPDTLQFGCKYEVEVNDSAWVMMTLKANGQVIADKVHKLYGSSAGQFQDIKIPIDYTSPATPDSLILIMISTDYFGTGNVSSISEFTVDDITFVGASAQLPNFDMESWGMTSRKQANLWYSQDDRNFDPLDSALVHQSTDAYHGNYALRLKNSLLHNQFAYIHTGPNNGLSVPEFPIQLRYTHFNGFYQYYPDANDTLFMYINLFYQGNPIGHGHFEQANITNTYTAFSVPIYYNTWDTPDSAGIMIFIRKNGQNAVPGNSWALIDYLSFSGNNTEIETTISTLTSMTLFPNPTEGNLTIHLNNLPPTAQEASIEIFDGMGRKVYEKFTNLDKFISLNLDDFPPQIYTVKITHTEFQLSTQFVKTR